MKLTEGEIRVLLRENGIKLARHINESAATKELILLTLERMRKFAEELE